MSPTLRGGGVPRRENGLLGRPQVPDPRVVPADSVLVRIGLRKSNIFAAMLMSYAVSISCMWTYLIATTSLEFLKSPAMIYYVISGCMQPLFARALYYEGITRIGVARAGPLRGIEPLFATRSTLARF